jgi:predicted secreted protein
MTEDEKKAMLESVKEQNVAQINEFKKDFEQLAVQAKSGMIDKDTFDAKLKELSGKLEKFDAEKFEQFKSSLEKLESALKAQGLEMKKLNETKSGSNVTGLRKEINDILDTEAYKEFVESN